MAEVEGALAGLDCGQCGHPTCNDYAHAIVEKNEPIDTCRPGGLRSAEAVARIMGVDPMPALPRKSRIGCRSPGRRRLVMPPVKVRDQAGEPLP